MSKPRGDGEQLPRCFLRENCLSKQSRSPSFPRWLHHLYAMLSKTCTNSLQYGRTGERQLCGQRKTRSLFPALTQTPHQVASLTSCLKILVAQLGEESLLRRFGKDLLHPARALAEGSPFLPLTTNMTPSQYDSSGCGQTWGWKAQDCL